MLGFREAIIALIVFAILYGVFLTWKFLSLAPRKSKKNFRKNAFSEPRFSMESQRSVKEESLPPDSVFPRSTPKNFENSHAENAERATVTPRNARKNGYSFEPPESNLQPTFLSSRIDAMEQQMVVIRQNLLELRTDLARLTETMTQEMERLRNMQTVSPMYNEAMRLANAGYNAQEVAQRCGITVAEAQLVSALARNQGE